MAPDSLRALLPEAHTILFFAPFYNRTGYGMGGRALAMAWHLAGLRVRIIPVDQVEPGVDDVDLSLLKALEQTPVQGALVAVFLHVPNPGWLQLQLPPGTLRIMCTTFDSSLQGNLPPAAWVDVCNRMDQLWVMSEHEIQGWCSAGMEPAKVRCQMVPHPWMENPYLPPVVRTKRPGPFRFLALAMYQPRRRWDTLIEAFLEEFKEESAVELYLKVNYPGWHPIPGQPKRDLAHLLEELRVRTGSRAQVIVDEELGTRMGVCSLLDSCDFFVSTDTSTTAPVFEAMVRGKRLILPEGYGGSSPLGARVLIAEDPTFTVSMTEEMLAYQPHHRGKPMPMLRVADVRRALREAYGLSKAGTAQPWPEWEAWTETFRVAEAIASSIQAISAGFAAREASPSPLPRLRWEGSQFVYHSLAHVNRQLCLGLISSGEAELSLIPYERDQFDASAEPAIAPLAERVLAPLSGPAQVHVRHQWPPNFTAPPEGAWVMIQPWEFGGIPQAWVEPMTREVDEIWAYSTWVRDRYIESGVPAEKVVVIPLGVDSNVFRPEGPQASLSTAKRFKFLFLGGTIPRKGIDLLLEAYQQAFTAADDVCLVIKGQGGEVYQGTELGQILQDLKARPGAPEIEYTTANLAEAELAALYRACDAFVMPYRGEGFGLPMAEAMASGKPVIATARGAAMDFLAEDRAYLIPCDRRRINMTEEFQPSAPGFWLEEPRLEDLVALLRHVASHPEEAAAKGRQGRLWVTANLGWEAPTRLILERLKVLAERTPLRFLPAEARIPEPGAREAFLLQPDWSGAAWVEILLAYVAAFRPGEPVGLVLLLGGTGSTQEEAQERVLELLARAGHEAFADVEIVDQPEDMLETLKRYDTFQWVAEVGAAGANRLGPRAKRLHEARLALRR